MKVIISHDVDHLFGSDHLKDLIYPKLWVRETLFFFQGKITYKEWFGRMLSPFKKSRNHIETLVDFDTSHGVKSTFFFGMSKGLGMSYEHNKTLPFIKFVTSRGFIAGVHGIDYEDEAKMREEFNKYTELSGASPLGIRMHYVRYNDKTFEKLSRCGYLFDSTEFNKKDGTCIKAPYKIGNMWEFPLTVMDGYLPYHFEDAKKRTLELVKAAEDQKIDYISILFHDYLFCDAWGETRKWYKWLIEYFESSPDFEFVSHLDAIKYLEQSNG